MAKMDFTLKDKRKPVPTETPHKHKRTTTTTRKESEREKIELNSLILNYYLSIMGEWSRGAVQ